MAVPAFGNDGMLPRGAVYGKADTGDEIYYGHSTTLEEISTRFVDAFPLSVTRSLLFRELHMLLEVVSSRLKWFSLWVSGAFVANVDNPKKIFVVLDTPGRHLADIAPHDGWLLGRLFTDATFCIDEYDEEFVLHTALRRAFPPGHLRYDVGYAEEMVTRDLAGHPYNDSEGGYLEIWSERSESFDAFYELLATGDQPPSDS